MTSFMEFMCSGHYWRQKRTEKIYIGSYICHWQSPFTYVHFKRMMPTYALCLTSYFTVSKNCIYLGFTYGIQCNIRVATPEQHIIISTLHQGYYSLVLMLWSYLVIYCLLFHLHLSLAIWWTPSVYLFGNVQFIFIFCWT